jgi:hypothetical protein
MQQQINLLQKEVKALRDMLSNKLADFDSRIQVVENQRDPRGTENKIEHLFDQIEKITDNMAQVMQKINQINLSDKFLEEFSNEDLKSLYTKSGLSSMQIKEYIEKNITNNEKITLPALSGYINGDIKNIKSRSILGKYLRDAAIKQTT